MLRPIIYELPANYRQAYHLKLLARERILLINALALIPLVIAVLALAGWWLLVLRLRGSWPGGFGAEWPWWLWALLVLAVSIALHEGLHGLAIHRTGHTARYGVMLSKGAFYATADGAYFWRDDFIRIALAPLAGISLLGMALIFLLPDMLAYYVGLGVALNAANSIGDLWMTVVVLRYPPDALVQDEADSIRIFVKD
jgi:hypothetical protein